MNNINSVNPVDAYSFCRVQIKAQIEIGELTLTPKIQQALDKLKKESDQYKMSKILKLLEKHKISHIMCGEKELRKMYDDLKYTSTFYLGIDFKVFEYVNKIIAEACRDN